MRGVSKVRIYTQRWRVAAYNALRSILEFLNSQYILGMMKEDSGTDPHEHYEIVSSDEGVGFIAILIKDVRSIRSSSSCGIEQRSRKEDVS